MNRPFTDSGERELPYFKAIISSSIVTNNVTRNGSGRTCITPTSRDYAYKPKYNNMKDAVNDNLEYCRVNYIPKKKKVGKRAKTVTLTTKPRTAVKTTLLGKVKAAIDDWNGDNDTMPRFSFYIMKNGTPTLRALKPGKSQTSTLTPFPALKKYVEYYNKGMISSAIPDDYNKLVDKMYEEGDLTKEERKEIMSSLRR